jgi:hypothetical protein
MGGLLTYRARIASNHFLRSILAVVGANLVAALLTIDRFVHARIQGPWFYRFEFLFGIFLVVIFFLVDKVLMSRALQKRWIPLLGALAGWAGGLLALVCSPMLTGEWSRITHLVKTPGGIIGLFLLPFVLMCWLVGAIAGLLWILIAGDYSTNVHGLS